MKRKTPSIIIAVFLLLLVVSTLQVISVRTVEAALNGSVIYGIPAQMEANEAQATIDACAAIRYYFSLTGDYIYLENYCGANTQNYIVYSVANYLETYPYDFATVFYKGHSVYLPPGHRLNPCTHNHTVLYDNDGGADADLIWDKEIGLRTVNHRHNFVFPWSCGTANEDQIGGEIIKNGGFETGDASYWTVGGPGDHTVTSEDRHWGSYSMLLGFKYKPNVANARDYAYQLITIPAGVTNVRLSFWYHMFTYDYYPYDMFEVYIAPVGGNPVRVFYKAGTYPPDLEEFGWEQVVIDISTYAGQSIYVYFDVANLYDTLYKTWCYIDDIAVMTSHTWGMAYSWLKITTLSLDGYAKPDGSGHCFIGFQYYSKPFTEPTGYNSYTYQTFVTMFYYYATVKGYTIKAALNKASQYYLGVLFENSVLYKGYNFTYEGVTYKCKMRVWGDGSMTLP
jgi:hypothetical protein